MSFLEPLLPASFIEALGLSLLHFVWQGALLAAVLWVILQFLSGRTPGTRYAVSMAAMILMAAAPILTFFLVFEGDQPGGTGIGATVPALDHRHEPTRLETLLPWTVGVWALGALVLGLRFAQSLWLVERMKHKGTNKIHASRLPDLARLCAEIGVRKTVTVVESSLAQVPTVVGWLRPVILVPTCALTGLAPDQLRAILAHELAHIRRHDYLLNLFQVVFESLLFYHPAVWWVSQRVRVEREHCCDDVAVSACGDVLTYARALAELDRSRDALPQVALGANGGSLMNRIRRLVEFHGRPGHRAAAWALPAFLSLAVLALAPVAALAQDGKKSDKLCPECSVKLQKMLAAEKAADGLGTAQVKVVSVDSKGRPIEQIVSDGSDFKVSGLSGGRYRVFTPSGEPKGDVLLNEGKIIANTDFGTDVLLSGSLDVKVADIQDLAVDRIATDLIGAVDLAIGQELVNISGMDLAIANEVFQLPDLEVAVGAVSTDLNQDPVRVRLKQGEPKRVKVKPDGSFEVKVDFAQPQRARTDEIGRYQVHFDPAQDRRVIGRVLDSKGQPIQGTVQVITEKGQDPVAGTVRYINAKENVDIDSLAFVVDPPGTGRYRLREKGHDDGDDDEHGNGVINIYIEGPVTFNGLGHSGADVRVHRDGAVDTHAPSVERLGGVAEPQIRQWLIRNIGVEVDTKAEAKSKKEKTRLQNIYFVRPDGGDKKDNAKIYIGGDSNLRGFYFRDSEDDDEDEHANEELIELIGLGSGGGGGDAGTLGLLLQDEELGDHLKEQIHRIRSGDAHGALHLLRSEGANGALRLTIPEVHGRELKLRAPDLNSEHVLKLLRADPEGRIRLHTAEKDGVHDALLHRIYRAHEDELRKAHSGTDAKDTKEKPKEAKKAKKVKTAGADTGPIVP